MSARRSAAACNWPRRSAVKAALRSAAGRVVVIGSWLLPWCDPWGKPRALLRPGDFRGMTAARDQPGRGKASRSGWCMAMPAPVRRSHPTWPAMVRETGGGPVRCGRASATGLEPGAGARVPRAVCGDPGPSRWRGSGHGGDEPDAAANGPVGRVHDQRRSLQRFGDGAEHREAGERIAKVRLAVDHQVRGQRVGAPRPGRRDDVAAHDDTPGVQSHTGTVTVYSWPRPDPGAPGCHRHTGGVAVGAVWARSDSGVVMLPGPPDA